MIDKPNLKNMTKKTKKAPTFKYGIEITKPFSKAMYAHNDGVANEMKANIIKKWEKLIRKCHFFRTFELISKKNRYT